MTRWKLQYFHDTPSPVSSTNNPALFTTGSGTRNDKLEVNFIDRMDLLIIMYVFDSDLINVAFFYLSSMPVKKGGFILIVGGR